MADNIFRAASTDSVLIETLLESESIKVQRVISRGQAFKASSFGSQPQRDNKFLLLLRGQVALESVDEERRGILTAGSYLVTTPNDGSRVDWTSQEEESIWLVIHFPGEMGRGLYPSPDVLKMVKEDMRRNLFRNTALIESLVETKDVRVERVISQGQASSLSVSCSQLHNELVLVMRGQTGLQVETERVSLQPGERGLQGGEFAGDLLKNVTVNLVPGDYLFIPPHSRNRVDWTSPDEQTVWLAVYFGGEPGEGKYPYPTGD
jgi:cupin 2 domain-containing protein